MNYSIDSLHGSYISALATVFVYTNKLWINGFLSYPQPLATLAN
jgi:hypothetical protein